MVIWKPGGEFSPGTESSSTLILDLPDFGPVRNKSLSSKSPGLCYVVTAARAAQDRIEDETVAQRSEVTSTVTQHPEQRLDIDQGLSLYLVKDGKTKVEKRKTKRDEFKTHTHKGQGKVRL